MKKTVIIAAILASFVLNTKAQNIQFTYVGNSPEGTENQIIADTLKIPLDERDISISALYTSPTLPRTHSLLRYIFK